MIYRTLGQTGLRVSALGFGGMRFPEDAGLETNAALVLEAYAGGINYFDTAPAYGRSEDIFGLALREMKKHAATRPYYISTKSSADTADGVRRDLEKSLRRMGLDAVDFFHVWCVYHPQDYARRKLNGVLRAFERVRDEGLTRHVSVSTHMTGREVEAMLADYPFASVLLGHSVVNYAYREAGVAAAARAGCGVAVMNPLAGGVIPQHPGRFGFVRTRPEESVVEASLRFLLNDPRLHVLLVGLSHPGQLREALGAVDGFQPLPPAEVARIRGQLREAFNALCTGCQYCQGCPQGIPIPKLMDTYNQYALSGDPATARDRLKWHWGIEPDDPLLQSCTGCGACEALCTQKLPIVERIQQVRRLVGGPR